MNIRDLMDEQHRGEEIREGKVGIRKLLLPVSILVLAALEVALCMGLIRAGVSIMQGSRPGWSAMCGKRDPGSIGEEICSFCVSLHPKSAPCSLPWGL